MGSIAIDCGLCVKDSINNIFSTHNILKRDRTHNFEDKMKFIQIPKKKVLDSKINNDICNSNTMKPGDIIIFHFFLKLAHLEYTTLRNGTLIDTGKSKIMNMQKSTSRNTGLYPFIFLQKKIMKLN